MRNAVRLLFILAAMVAGLSWLSAPRAAAPIRVMLLDGANNHDWASTTPLVRKALDDAGLFETTVVTVPNAQVDAFKPDWSRYDVIVFNYNTGITGEAPQWPADTKASFARFVSEGGGVVSVHAADNGFAAWPEFNE